MVREKFEANAHAHLCNTMNKVLHAHIVLYLCKCMHVTVSPYLALLFSLLC